MATLAKAPSTVFKRISPREAVVLIFVACLVPILVHLAPWSGTRPLGAYLLPMFWAAFVAVYFYGPIAGAAIGLSAPALNLFIAGLPAWRFLGVVSFEIVVFAVFTAWVIRKFPRLGLVAPLGYLVAKIGSALLTAPATLVGDPGAPGRFLLHALVGPAAGLVVLAVINAALVKFYPKS